MSLLESCLKRKNIIRNDLIAIFVPQKIMQIKDFLLYVVPDSGDKDIVVY